MRESPKYIFLMAVFLLSACSGKTANPLADQVAAAAGRWQAQDVRSYHLVVSDISMWHMQTYDIRVADGKVTAHSAVCSRAPLETAACQVKPYKPEDYLPAALFEQARQAANASTNPDMKVNLTFDEKYALPRDILSDNKKATDSMHAIKVTTFEAASE